MALVCRRGVGLIRLWYQASSFYGTMHRLAASPIVMARSAGCLGATEALADAARRRGVGVMPVEEI
jgi:hypothetical protein